MDVQLLALRRTPLIGDRSAAIMDTSQIQRKVSLQPIYYKLGPEKSGALINWHAPTGCDTTVHIYGKANKGYLANCMKETPTIPIALAGHGQGD